MHNNYGIKYNQQHNNNNNGIKLLDSYKAKFQMENKDLDFKNQTLNK